MGMATYYENFSLLEELVSNRIHVAFTDPDKASTAAERSRRWAQQKGELSAYDNAISLALTETRRTLYNIQPEEKLLAVDAWDITLWFKENESLWRTKQSLSETIEIVAATLNSSFIFWEDMDKSRENDRRNKILAGDLEPSPLDRVWLEEMAQTLGGAVLPYAKALEKLDHPLVTLKKD